MFTDSLSHLNKVITRFLGDFIHLIFPNSCVICNNETPQKKILICHLCEQNLEFTKMENDSENSKTKKVFWGRIPIEQGFSLLYFSQKNYTQKLLHAVKYQNQTKLTIQMGEMIGSTLKDKATFSNLDAIIPVPIHYKKQFDRGYNQSELLCKGIDNILKVKIEKNIVFRIKNSKSQTRLNKFLRWENVQKTYKVSDEIMNINLKHIAIVDDVITTGSTIESIALEILKKNPNLKISVISLALAQ